MITTVPHQLAKGEAPGSAAAAAAIQHSQNQAKQGAVSSKHLPHLLDAADAAQDHLMLALLPPAAPAAAVDAELAFALPLLPRVQGKQLDARTIAVQHPEPANCSICCFALQLNFCLTEWTTVPAAACLILSKSVCF